jgi:hypothetical protein
MSIYFGVRNKVTGQLLGQSDAFCFEIPVLSHSLTKAKALASRWPFLETCALSEDKSPSSGSKVYIIDGKRVNLDLITVESGDLSK